MVITLASFSKIILGVLVMGFKTWWGKLEYWKRGGLIGILLGLFIYLLTFNGSEQTIWYNQLIGHFGYFTFCKIFKAGPGGDCGWGFVLIGWILLPIIYGIICLSLGLVANRIRKN